MKSKMQIYDSEFAHCQGMSDAPPTHFEWTRNNNSISNISWFTDSQLHKVDTSSSKVKVALLLEPPVIHGAMYDWIVQNEHKFNYILTHQKFLIERNKHYDTPKYLYYPMGSSWIRDKDRTIYPKNKLLSIIASNKTISIGHRLRHEIIQRYPGRIDLYGRGYKPITYKLEGYKDHMFSFAVMNCKTDDYFTEILIDCFMTGTIPLWWGTDNIDNYFNSDGIISFNSLEELDDIMNSLNEELYLSKIEAVKDNFERAKKYAITEDWLWGEYPFLFEANN